MFKTILREGDIVKVQQAKKLVSIDGYVNYAAIFELKEGEKLDKLLEYAGGLKPNASKSHIKVLRYKNNKFVKTFDITLEEAKRFAMQNGDRVYIYPLDFAAKRSINIYGNVIRPGSYELGKAKDLTAFFKKEIKSRFKEFFLPQTYFEYAVLRRYGEDLSFKTESFNLLDVIEGRTKVALKPNDQIFIFAQDDIFTEAYVTTIGNGILIHPGKLRYVKGMTLQDAINASGIDGVPDDKVRVTTFYTEDYMPKTTFYSLQNDGNVTLNPYDEVEVFDYYNVHVLEPVTISGEVIKPTTVYYEKGMNLKELLEMAGGFTKKAYTKSIIITRYYVDENQERQQKTLNFDLTKTSLEDIKLAPYDRVKVSKILGWDSSDYETVSISGEVRKPLTTKYGKGMTVDDLIVMADGLTKKAYTKSITITRYYVDENQERQQKTLSFDLTKTSLKDIKLAPYDQVKISRILGWDAPEYETVSISGEVRKPLTTKYGKGMTVDDLIVMADGLTKRAYTKELEIVRYYIDANQTRQRTILKEKLDGKSFADIELRPYDEVKIFTIPNWYEKQYVELRGEVRFPGKYPIETGERLASVIKRAGGFTNEAFLRGAVFTRESVRKNQIRNYNQTLAKLKRKLAIYNAMPANAKESASAENPVSILNEVIGEAKKYQPLGRVAIKLDENLTRFEKSPYNIVLKNKDTLTIPSTIDTVTVFGEVFNPSSFVYDDKLDSEDYIKLASGFTRAADKDSVYVIHADGTSEPIVSDWLFWRTYANIEKGDTIVVPIYIKEYNNLDLWESISKIMAGFAVTAATLNTLGIF